MASRSKMGMRKKSFRSLSNLHSPSSWLEEERSLTLTQPHFLDCCFLCHRRLASHSDIFMYRGDTAFCTEECREEQIEIDEAKERGARRAGLKKKAAKRNDGERAKARGVLVAV